MHAGRPLPDLSQGQFGHSFKWGVSSSAFQTEGFDDADGKGPSNWDIFTLNKRKIINGDNAKQACEFYTRFRDDISLINSLHIPNFRFSLSWSRILPMGIGSVNQQGVDYYNQVIDFCLESGIEPWITLYHWDLPQALEEKGGWVNREIIDWFSAYTTHCVRLFGDRVKNWMILNEPMVFTGAGYFLGIHAPGRKGWSNFIPAIHHAVLCQAAGARIIKKEQPVAQVGSTFSCSLIMPSTTSMHDTMAVRRTDALLNRLFAEPAFGMGYPVADLPFLKKIEKYMKSGDDQAMQADFDFIGIQNYTREIVKYSFFIPYLKARIIPARNRKVFHTVMNWEVYPESIYEMIKKFSAYPQVKKIIITENGAAFPDHLKDDRIDDHDRTHYIASCLEQVLKARKEGLKIDGYFVWSLTDNFEWTEGYRPRFGLLYVDYKTQKRYIKNSGLWYREFLKST